MEVQLSPVVCVHAVSVLLFDAAAAPLGPPLLVHQADHHSQRAHGYEDHCSDHTWKRRREGTLDDGGVVASDLSSAGVLAVCLALHTLKEGLLHVWSLIE